MNTVIDKISRNSIFCKVVLFALLILGTATVGAKGKTHIESPRDGFSVKRIITIKGTVESSKPRARLIINGIPQYVKVSDGRFNVAVVPSPGLNLIEVQGDGSSDKVSFYSKAPSRDVKIVLTWDTATDVDLWVIDPKGEKCYYGHKNTTSGGNLDIDIVTGYGPETFTMARAVPGPYSVQVQYYSAGSAPITNVKLFVILYEGTPREEVREFDFVMNKGHQVYHISDFVVENYE